MPYYGASLLQPPWMVIVIICMVKPNELIAQLNESKSKKKFKFGNFSTIWTTWGRINILYYRRGILLLPCYCIILQDLHLRKKCNCFLLVCRWKLWVFAILSQDKVKLYVPLITMSICILRYVENRKMVAIVKTIFDLKGTSSNNKVLCVSHMVCNRQIACAKTMIDVCYRKAYYRKMRVKHPTIKLFAASLKYRIRSELYRYAVNSKWL